MLLEYPQQTLVTAPLRLLCLPLCSTVTPDSSSVHTWSSPHWTVRAKSFNLFISCLPTPQWLYIIIVHMYWALTICASTVLDASHILSHLISNLMWLILYYPIIRGKNWIWLCVTNCSHRYTDPGGRGWVTPRSSSWHLSLQLITIPYEVG